MFVLVTGLVTPPNSPENDQNNSVPDNSPFLTDFPVFYGHYSPESSFNCKNQPVLLMPA